MGKKKMFYAVTLVLLLTLVCVKDNLFSQVISDAAFEKEGLTKQDLSEISNYYYKNPQPDKLISYLKAVLSQDALIAHELFFGPFVHFIATIAQNDTILLNRVKELKGSYSGIPKDAIERIIKETENFKSLMPISPIDLNYLWAEFSATGKKVPVRKIISIFDNPESASNLLLAAAESSLKFNAEVHQAVYEIIREDAATAQGMKKQVLDKVLKDIGMKWQKYGFVQEGVLNEKIARLDQMIKDNPGDANNYLARGGVLANNFNYDKALEDFHKALSLNQNLPIANNYVGYIYVNQGKYDEAEPYLKKAIEQAPNFSKPYFNLARIYFRRNALDKAIEQITKTIEYEPSSYEAYIMRAEIYYNKKEYDKSINDLEQAIKLNASLKERLDAQIKAIQLEKSQKANN